MSPYINSCGAKVPSRDGSRHSSPRAPRRQTALRRASSRHPGISLSVSLCLCLSLSLSLPLTPSHSLSLPLSLFLPPSHSHFHSFSLAVLFSSQILFDAISLSLTRSLATCLSTTPPPPPLTLFPLFSFVPPSLPPRPPFARAGRRSTLLTCLLLVFATFPRWEPVFLYLTISVSYFSPLLLASVYLLTLLLRQAHAFCMYEYTYVFRPHMFAYTNNDEHKFENSTDRQRSPEGCSCLRSRGRRP